MFFTAQLRSAHGICNCCRPGHKCDGSTGHGDCPTAPPFDCKHPPSDCVTALRKLHGGRSCCGCLKGNCPTACQSVPQHWTLPHAY